MFRTPYETLACKHYKPDTIIRDLQRAHTFDRNFDPMATSNGYKMVDALMVTPHPDYSSLKSFTQPLYITADRKEHLIFDFRPMMRMGREEGSYRVTSEADYALNIVRCALMQSVDEGWSLMNLKTYPAKVFVRWIVGALAGRMALEVEHQAKLSVILAYYYYSLIHDEKSIDDEKMVLLATRVAEVTMVPTPQVLAWAEEIPAMNDLASLCESIRLNTGSARLDKIKPTDLFALLNSSWYGVNGRENAAVALEHIPTFIGMLYSAVTDRSFRKAVLTARAEKVGRQTERKQWADSVKRQVSNRYQ